MPRENHFQHPIEEIATELVEDLPNKEEFLPYARSGAAQAIAGIRRGVYFVSALELTTGSKIAAEALANQRLTIAVAFWMLKGGNSPVNRWDEVDKRYFLGLVIQDSMEADKRVLQQGRLRADMYGMPKQEVHTLDTLEADITRRTNAVKKLTERSSKTQQR